VFYLICHSTGTLGHTYLGQGIEGGRCGQHLGSLGKTLQSEQGSCGQWVSGAQATCSPWHLEIGASCFGGTLGSRLSKSAFRNCCFGFFGFFWVGLGFEFRASHSGYFKDGGLSNYFPRLAWSCNLQISASQVAGITD
jgi:hypothetical protein